MKKLFTLLATALLLTSLVGCQKKEETQDPDPVVETESYDVVVIGAGGAGMTAAIEAYDQGAGVVIVEKMSVAGGNTIKASAGMNASETVFQEAQGIEDSNETFYDDTFKGGYEKNDPELLQYMVENSADAIAWLDSLGITLDNITTTGGMSVSRTHRPTDGASIGGYLVSGLLAQINERNIPIQYNTYAYEIVVDDAGTVTGVKVEYTENGEAKTKLIEAKAVVVTTGGFGANEEMYTSYAPELAGFVTTNHSGATGDGITMITAIGGATVAMEEIQIHPTVEQETSAMITEAVRSGGAILVSQEGTRFFNELETRDKVSAAIIALPEGYSYVVFDQTVRDNNKAIESYISNGLVIEGNTIEELAEKLDMDPAILAETIATWNTSVASGSDAEFGRTTGMENPLATAPYYAIKIAPGVHHTMGGVKINTHTQVLREDGSAIAGLYAAGEVTGGIHGGNRIGGNAVTDIIVFGRQAGTQAGLYAMNNGGVGHPEAPVQNGDDDTAAIKDGVEAQYTDGVYTEEVTGHNGPLTVQVTVEGGYITKVEVTSHEETETLFDAVMDQMVPTIIYEQSTEVDVITSATVTSEAILEAVNKVIEQAKK